MATAAHRCTYMYISHITFASIFQRVIQKRKYVYFSNIVKWKYIFACSFLRFLGHKWMTAKISIFDKVIMLHMWKSSLIFHNLKPDCKCFLTEAYTHSDFIIWNFNHVCYVCSHSTWLRCKENTTNYKKNNFSPKFCFSERNNCAKLIRGKRWNRKEVCS